MTKPKIYFFIFNLENAIEILGDSIEDGGVDRTVIDCWQNQLGQMADFPPLLTFLIFDL